LVGFGVTATPLVTGPVVSTMPPGYSSAPISMPGADGRA